MKPFKNTELSNRMCTDCGKPLKMNLLAKRPTAELCFRCFYPKETKRRGGHGQGRQIKNFPPFL